MPAVLCSNCATDLPDGSQFCLKCGQPVTGLPNPELSTAIVCGVACSKCGANLPDGAEFCAKCGKPVSLPAKNPPAAGVAAASTTVPASLSRPRRAGRLVLWSLLAAVLGGIVWAATSDNPFAQGIQELVGWKHDQAILETPFSVTANNFRYYKFSLPEGSMNVAIIGQFAASSAGSKNSKRPDEKAANDKTSEAQASNQIEVYVLSEPAFTVWQNGYAASSVYESGRVSQGSIEADLPAGAGIYYLVFSNKFSNSRSKNVNATVLLRYKSWLPESLRRAKDRFSNWLGV